MLNQSAILFVAKLAGYGLRLVLPFFLVRLLSVADFGAYRQFFLLDLYIEALFQLGLNQALYYFIPRDVRNAGAYFLNSIIMNLAGFVVAFLIIGLFVGPLSRWLNIAILREAFGLLAGYVIVMMLVAGCDACLTARQSVRAAAVFEILGQTIASAACVVTAFMTRSLDWVLAVLVAARALQLIGMLAFIHWRLHGFRAERYFFGIKEQIRYGVVLGLAGALMSQLARLHDFMVSRYFGTEVYAVYSAGCTELPIIQLFTQSVAVVSLGQFALLEQRGDWEGTRDLWRRVLTSSYAVALPVVVLLLVLAEPIVRFMFTDAYAEAVPIFRINTILKLGLVFNATLVLRAMSRNDVTIRVNLVALILAGPMLYLGMKWGGSLGIIAAQALIMIGSRLACVAVMNRIVPTPLPYFVSVADVMGFYRESWGKACARLRSRRNRCETSNSGGA